MTGKKRNDLFNISNCARISFTRDYNSCVAVNSIFYLKICSFTVDLCKKENVSHTSYCSWILTSQHN